MGLRSDAGLLAEEYNPKTNGRPGATYANAVLTALGSIGVSVVRWKAYLEKEKPPEMDDDDWERLYLPTGEDDAKEPLLKTPETPMLWDSPHVTRRVAAQRSRFMIFGTDPLWLVKMEKKKDSLLSSITIPRGSINRIRQELRDAGITESVVYPDLDGLGRELRQMWEGRR
jgi:hypothetical protein